MVSKPEGKKEKNDKQRGGTMGPIPHQKWQSRRGGRVYGRSFNSERPRPRNRCVNQNNGTRYKDSFSKDWFVANEKITEELSSNKRGLIAG